MADTEVIDKLFLELSQFSTATTAKEKKLRDVVLMLDSMVRNKEPHTKDSRQLVKEVLER